MASSSGGRYESINIRDCDRDFVELGKARHRLKAALQYYTSDYVLTHCNVDM